jgi:hypothetical protein
MTVNFAYHLPKRWRLSLARWFPHARSSAISQTSPIVDGRQAYEDDYARAMSNPRARTFYEYASQKMDAWLQLVETRMDSGMTSEQVAKQMNVKLKEVLRFEEGGYDLFPLDFWYSYAEALGFTVRFAIERMAT